MLGSLAVWTLQLVHAYLEDSVTEGVRHNFV